MRMRVHYKCLVDLTMEVDVTKEPKENFIKRVDNEIDQAFGDMIEDELSGEEAKVAITRKLISFEEIED